jgi:hypothetical protein
MVLKGYGIEKSINTQRKWMLIPYLVSSSNSKALQASLAILVDEGKIKWDDHQIPS